MPETETRASRGSQDLYVCGRYVGNKMGQEKKGIWCALFLGIFAFVVPGEYLKGVFSNPWAIRMFTTVRGPRIRGKYLEMVSIAV